MHLYQTVGCPVHIHILYRNHFTCAFFYHIIRSIIINNTILSPATPTPTPLVIPIQIFYIYILPPVEIENHCHYELLSHTSIVPLSLLQTMMIFCSRLVSTSRNNNNWFNSGCTSRFSRCSNTECTRR